MMRQRTLSVRQRAHQLLKLAVSDRRAAERAFNDLCQADQLALVGKVRGREKKELLFLSRDCGRLVRALPADDLYLTVKDCGDADAAILLDLGSGAQVTYLLDVDCWRRDRLDRARVARWMELLLDMDEEATRSRLADVDPHFLAAALAPRLEAFNVSKAQLWLNEDMGVPYLFTPSDLVCGEGLTREFVERLYAADARLFAAMCRLMIFDENVEQSAYAERRRRMAAREVPSYEDALHVYAAPGRPPAARAPAAPSVAPGAVARAAPSRSFLAQALKHMIRNGSAPCEAVERMGRDLIHLANLVAVADGLEPTLQSRRKTIRKVSACVSLGLETRANGDRQRAESLLIEDSLLDLFRTGSALTRGLAARAREVLSDPRLVRDEEQVLSLDAQEAVLLRAAAEDSPRRVLANGGTARIETVSELAAARAGVDRVAALVDALCRRLPLGLPDILALEAGRHPQDAGLIRLSMVLMVNLENALLGRSEEVFRLPTVSERQSAADTSLAGDRVSLAACRRVRDWVRDRTTGTEDEPALRSLFDAHLDEWTEDLLYLRQCRRSACPPRAQRIWGLTGMAAWRPAPQPEYPAAGAGDR